MSFHDPDLSRLLHEARLVEIGGSRQAQRAATASRLQRRAERLQQKAERVSRRAERAAAQVRLSVARVI